MRSYFLSFRPLILIAALMLGAAFSWHIGYFLNSRSIHTLTDEDAVFEKSNSSTENTLKTRWPKSRFANLIGNSQKESSQNQKSPDQTTHTTTLRSKISELSLKPQLSQKEAVFLSNIARDKSQSYTLRTDAFRILTSKMPPTTKQAQEIRVKSASQN